MGKDLVGEPDQTTRIERFQSLEAGQYWKAIMPVEKENIDEGMVLLIESLRVVDNVAHTVVLRTHPRNYDRTVDVPRGDGYRTTRFTRHEFLLKDFLDAFEFCPDAEVVRQKELQGVQAEVATLQEGLLSLQSDHNKMSAAVQAKLAEARQGEKEDVPTLPAHAQGRRDMSAFTGPAAQSLPAGIDESGVSALKAVADEQLLVAKAQGDVLKEASTAITETIERMTPFYEEQAAAALARTEEVRNRIGKIQEGIASLDLYVGKDVLVEPIVTGKSASHQEPLSLIQRKLIAEEELALYLDISEWFDFRSINKFDQALNDHPELVEQIFPTPRCVLVMAMRRKDLNYGDAWANFSYNQRNKAVFLLVRDGGNIYRVYSSVESHLAASHLFPSKNEYDRIFKGIDGDQITFENLAYTRSLSRYEAAALHYKRFLLLLCGLDHRERLFGDFYDGPQDFSFISMGFQSAYMRFVHDESQAIGDHTMPPLSEWIRQKNSYLQSGSRVLCDWKSCMDADTAPGAAKGYDTSWGGPRGINYWPDNDHDVVVATRRGEDHYATILVRGETQRGKPRTFNCQVLLSDRMVDERMPFLCLDTVTLDDIEWYMHNREARINHLLFIRLFKAAREHLQDERERDRLARTSLKEEISSLGGLDKDELEQQVEEAIRLWRAKHRGDAPPRPDGEDTAPWKSLIKIAHMLVNANEDLIEAAGKFAADSGLTPLRLVLANDSRYSLYCAPEEGECDDRLEPHAWVHKISLTQNQRGLGRAATTWAALPRATAGERVIHEWPEAEEWQARDSRFTSLSAKVDTMSRASSWVALRDSWMAPLSEEQFLDRIDAWESARDILIGSGKYVVNPIVAIPIGFALLPNRKDVTAICVTIDAHTALNAIAPSESARAHLRARYASLYARAQKANEQFDHDLEKNQPWRLAWVSAKHLKHGEFGMAVTKEHVKDLTIRRQPDLDFSLSSLLNRSDDKRPAIWMEDCFQEDKTPGLNAAFQQHLPDDFESMEISIYRDLAAKKLGQTRTVVDIYPTEDDHEPPFTNYSCITLSANSRAAAIACAKQQVKAKLAIDETAPDGVIRLETGYRKTSSPDNAKVEQRGP